MSSQLVTTNLNQLCTNAIMQQTILPSEDEDLDLKRKKPNSLSVSNLIADSNKSPSPVDASNSPVSITDNNSDLVTKLSTKIPTTISSSPTPLPSVLPVSLSNTTSTLPTKFSNELSYTLSSLPKTLNSPMIPLPSLPTTTTIQSLPLALPLTLTSSPTPYINTTTTALNTLNTINNLALNLNTINDQTKLIESNQKKQNKASDPVNFPNFSYNLLNSFLTTKLKSVNENVTDRSRSDDLSEEDSLTSQANSAPLSNVNQQINHLNTIKATANCNSTNLNGSIIEKTFKLNQTQLDSQDDTESKKSDNEDDILMEDSELDSKQAENRRRRTAFTSEQLLELEKEFQGRYLSFSNLYILLNSPLFYKS